MSDFKAKMHQIQFRLGFCPRPCWGSLSAPTDPLVAIGGSTSMGRGGKKGEDGRRIGRGKGREWDGKGKGGKRRGMAEGKERGKGRGGEEREGSGRGREGEEKGAPTSS